MNLDLLHRHIKPLDFSVPPSISDAELSYFRFYGIDLEERFENVNHYFGSFQSSRFDIVAHYYKNNSATATCFIVHGYYDHSGLYRHLIEYCLKRNFSVVIIDLPGHGLSTGEQASIADFEYYQTLVDDLLAKFKNETPQPWYGLGQSTGAAILAEYLLRHGNNVFDKTILLAPLLYPVQWRWSCFKHSIAKRFVQRIKRQFVENSGDKEFLTFLKDQDTLQSRYMSLQWVTALRKWIKRFLTFPACDHAPLVVQGREDGTVDWEKNIDIYRQKFPRMKSLYLEKGHHHLANDSADVREKLCAAMDVYFDVFTNGN